MSKIPNVVWKPTGLTKRTFLFYGPMAPGAHRAHIFLINLYIYLFFNIYIVINILPIEVQVQVQVQV